MLAKALAVFSIVLLPGCVTVDHLSRVKADIRQSDYEYSKDLIEKVKVGDLPAHHALTRLKLRYRQEERGPL